MEQRPLKHEGVHMSRPPDRKPSPAPPAKLHADGGTRRPETPSLEGRVPLPEELTGRASGTDDDLVALFANRSSAHLADGFRGGSDDEEVTDEPSDGVKRDARLPDAPAE